MTALETLAALRALPDDAQVTLTVRKSDLVRALEQRAEGPALITTTQAEEQLGYAADRWRRWAAAGKIPGAYQDGEGGPWHLPRAACERHLRRLQGRAARRIDPAEAAGGSSSPSHHRSLARGPRRPRLQLQSAEGAARPSAP